MRESIRFNLRKPGKATGDSGLSVSSPCVFIDGALSPPEELHAVLRTDQTGRILEASEDAARMLGQSSEDLMTRNIAEVVLRIDAVVMDLAARACESGREVSLDVVCCRHDGTTFTSECSVSLVPGIKSGGKQLCFVFSQNGKPEVGEVMDARLARAERLEMAGTLAGQIAHDFNNLLTPLLATRS